MLGLGTAFYGVGPTLSAGENVAVDNNNYSLAFDGNDHLTVSDDNSLSFADGSANSAMSISFWLRVGDLSANHGLIVKGEEYEIHFTASYNRLMFRRVDNDANGHIRRESGTNSIVADTWQHCLVTSDDSEAGGGITWYIDGALTQLSSSTASYTASENDSTDLYIGRGVQTVSGSIGTSYHYLTGDIANIAFWDAELTAANAVTLSSSGISYDVANSGIATANLQASWKFAEQTGTTVADSSSNSNTASFAGDPTWVTE